MLDNSALERDWQLCRNTHIVPKSHILYISRSRTSPAFLRLTLVLFWVTGALLALVYGLSAGASLFAPPPLEFLVFLIVAPILALLYLTVAELCVCGGLFIFPISWHNLRFFGELIEFTIKHVAMSSYGPIPTIAMRLSVTDAPKFVR